MCASLSWLYNYFVLFPIIIYILEKGSDGSEYGITKQKDVASDVRVEYVNGAALTQPPCFSNTDPLNMDAIDTGYFSSYRIPVPYSMLLDVSGQMAALSSLRIQMRI